MNEALLSSKLNFICTLYTIHAHYHLKKLIQRIDIIIFLAVFSKSYYYFQHADIYLRLLINPALQLFYEYYLRFTGNISFMINSVSIVNSDLLFCTS